MFLLLRVRRIEYNNKVLSNLESRNVDNCYTHNFRDIRKLLLQ